MGTYELVPLAQCSINHRSFFFFFSLNDPSYTFCIDPQFIVYLDVLSILYSFSSGRTVHIIQHPWTGSPSLFHPTLLLPFTFPFFLLSLPRFLLPTQHNLLFYACFLLFAFFFLLLLLSVAHYEYFRRASHICACFCAALPSYAVTSLCYPLTAHLTKRKVFYRLYYWRSTYCLEKRLRTSQKLSDYCASHTSDCRQVPSFFNFITGSQVLES